MSGAEILARRTTTARELAWIHLGLLGASAVTSALTCIVASRLVWNCTPSLPLGLYWLSPSESPTTGDLVAFPVPQDVRDLVIERRYLPPRAELVKTIVARAGDRVCTEDGTLSINGAPLGTIRTEDTAGRPLPHYEGCGPVPEGLVFVASHYDRSFDSRTFGPVPTAAIRGKVTPLWTY
jgi:conjugative transfer signal peptidase TraF